MSSSAVNALRSHLLTEVRRCIHPPVDRFRHRWLAPMPPSEEGARWIEARARGERGDLPGGAGDRFAIGDYGLGLFHHDVSESAIALCASGDPELVEACFGSLLCFLDCARPDGCIHRIELPHKARDPEPAKPVIAQLALRAIDALGPSGLERAAQHRVLPRLRNFVDYLERSHTGMHGLLLTPSARASGFDSDLMTAGLPDGSVEGPDSNAFLVIEHRAIAALAARLGDDRAADEHRRRAAEIAERIERLLFHEDEHGGTYVALRFVHGAARFEDELVAHRSPDGDVEPILTWASMLPLYAGIPGPERAAAIVRRLTDPAGYWGPHGVRTLPATSPYFHQAPRVMLWDPRRGQRGPVSNWNGPVWVLANYYMARALSRYGYDTLAKELDDKTVALLSADLEQTGALHECYDDRGHGLWPRRGTFLSWNVLALILPGTTDPVLAAT